MAFYVDGGGEKMKIDSAGNVGIGTTNPESSLHVAGTRKHNPSSTGIHMGIDSGGRTAIEIVGLDNNYSYIDFTKPKSDYRGRIIYAHTNNSTDHMDFYTNGTTIPKMRIDSSGNVGIGTTNPGHKLDVYGVVASFGTELTSDDRIKYNKQDINGITAINIINQLNPQKYEKIIEKPQNKNGVWIPTDAQWRSTERDATINETDDEGNVTTRPKWKWNNEIGLIAQDIKLINELQNSVTGEEVDESGNQTPLSLNYNYIFSYHIAATKQLISELNVEKTKVTTLETKVTTLETELAAIKTHLGL